MMYMSPGVRSNVWSPLRNRSRGFSLVEVMMSVVLVAIGTALAVPSFHDQVEKRQITNGAEQLAAFVNTAQGTAMKMNQVITVSWDFTDSDDWCIGATDNAGGCDCNVTRWSNDDYCKIAGDTYKLDDSMSKDPGLVHQISGDGAYSFDPVRGLLTDLDDSLTMELRSRSGDFRLNLLVNNAGRVTVCSDSSDHAIPGYEVCPVAVEVEFVEAGP